MKRRIPWRWVAVIGGAAVAIWVIVEVILAGIGTPPLPPDQMGITLRGGRVQEPPARWTACTTVSCSGTASPI